MRTAVSALILAAAAISLTTATASAQSGTTRIEPRPFYGATVTLEEGVRVFRPLPVTRHVIVNPGSRTPLNLSFNDTRVVEHATSHNYHYGNQDHGHAYGTAGPIGYYGRERGHHPRREGRAGAFNTGR